MTLALPRRRGLNRTNEWFAKWLEQTVIAFGSLLPEDQCDVLDQLLSVSTINNLYHVQDFITAILKKDIITLAPDVVQGKIVSYLDGKTLLICTLVSPMWELILSLKQDAWRKRCLGADYLAKTASPCNSGCEISTNCDVSTWKDLYERAYYTNFTMEHDHCFQFLKDELCPEKYVGVVAIDYHEGYLALVIEGSKETCVKVVKYQDHRFVDVYRTCCNNYQPRVSCIKLFKNHWFVTGHFSGYISFWNMKRLQECKSFLGHSSPVFSTDFLPELNIAVSGSADRTVKIWTFQSGTHITSLPDQEHWALKVCLRCHKQLKMNTFLCNKNVLIVQTRQNIHFWVWPACYEDNSVGNIADLSCILSIPIQTVTELFTPGFTFHENHIYFVKQEIEENGELLKVVVPSGEIVSRYQLDFRVKKLLGCGSVFVMIMSCTANKNGSNLRMYRFPSPTGATLLEVGSGYSIANTRMKTPDGSQMCVCESNWLHGFSGHNHEGPVLAVAVTASNFYSELSILEWRPNIRSTGKKLFSSQVASKCKPEKKPPP